MLLKELLQNIEILLPSDSAMNGDKIGLQLQSGRTEISKLLVTMEITEEVALEAIQIGADCIVAFHPLIFRPLAEISENERVGRITTMLIQNSIAMISVHTSYDAYFNGTSKLIADRLSLEVEGFLVPNALREKCGMGIICRANPELSEQELVSRVSEKLFSPVKFTRGPKTSGISKIAIVGGSGYSFINDVIASKADAFITADISYHNFHAARGNLLLIDPGHYEMEQFVAIGIAELLKNSIGEKVEIDVSNCHSNPVSYCCSAEPEQKQKEYLNNVKIKWYNENGN